MPVHRSYLARKTQRISGDDHGFLDFTGINQDRRQEGSIEQATSIVPFRHPQ